MNQKSTVDEKWEIVRQIKTIAVENAYKPIILALVKSPTAPLAISVRDASIVPYTMSVYLLQIQTKAQRLFHPQTKVKKLVITMSRARQASPLFVQFKKERSEAKIELLPKP